MAITRTPMVDDDGSGTTGTIINNAWKQELYNQIDTMVGTLIWAPSDASGAGLAFAVTGGRYCVVGNMVSFWGWVTYPATATGQNATIGGLPFANGPIHAGAVLTLGGVPTQFHLAAGAVNILLINPATSAPHPNSALSNVQLIFQGAYLKA